MLQDITEKSLQEYIWNNRENLISFFSEPTFPDKIIMDNPSYLSASEMLYNMLLTKLEKQWELLKYIELTGVEVPLKKDNDSTIRADFLGVVSGGNGLTVVELKKSGQTERQAFTELYAYGNHIKNLFSLMSTMDINYVLISPMEERIVKESAIHSLIYEQTNFFALIPIPKVVNKQIQSLELKPWIPDLSEFKQILDGTLSENNFDVFKVVWMDEPGEWNPEKKGEDPDEFITARMNIVSSCAAQLMEAKGIHGFVYTSQLWSELKEKLPFTNSLVLVGINPYKATKNRYLIKEGFSENEADEQSINSVNFLDIIPELAKNAETIHRKNNFLSDLSISWDNELASIGFEVVKMLTKSSKRKHSITDHGTFTWKEYQVNPLEDVHTHNFDIKPTGLIRELWWEFTKSDYDYIREKGYKDHLQYESGDFPEEIVDLIYDQFHVREFIRRLFNPFGQWDGDFGDSEE